MHQIVKKANSLFGCQGFGQDSCLLIIAFTKISIKLIPADCKTWFLLFVKNSRVLDILHNKPHWWKA